MLAEFWADGPNSETLPGHWNVLANQCRTTPAWRSGWAGEGPLLDDLEWDVKLYLALNGAVHDAAVAGWGSKAVYDYSRPISMIRTSADSGSRRSPAAPRSTPQVCR